MTDFVVRCKGCSKDLNVEIYSAGMSDEGFFVCDRDSTVLTISTWNQTFQKKLDSILGGSRTAPWTESQFRLVEAQLKPCLCGGMFKHDVLPKCPNCGTVLSIPDWPGRSPLDKSNYMVVNREIDGDKQDPWRDEKTNPS